MLEDGISTEKKSPICLVTLVATKSSNFTPLKDHRTCPNNQLEQ
jgi:hypothetical protein